MILTNGKLKENEMVICVSEMISDLYDKGSQLYRNKSMTLVNMRMKMRKDRSMESGT